MYNTAVIATQPLYQSNRRSLLDKTLEFVVERLGEDISLEELAEYLGTSRFSLCRRFQQRFGVTPIRWLWNFRALLAHQFIEIEPRWSLTDVAFFCGFTSSAHFSRFFRQVHGNSPSQHKAQCVEKVRHVFSQYRLRDLDVSLVSNSDFEFLKKLANDAMRLNLDQLN